MSARRKTTFFSTQALALDIVPHAFHDGAAPFSPPESHSPPDSLRKISIQNP
jgi:hypothetical protein